MQRRQFGLPLQRSHESHARRVGLGFVQQSAKCHIRNHDVDIHLPFSQSFSHSFHESPQGLLLERFTRGVYPPG